MLVKLAFIVIFSLRNACRALITASPVSLSSSALLAGRVTILANFRNHATPNALLAHSLALIIHAHCVGLLATNA